MSSSELDENGRRFLIQLFEQTKGDPSVQVSMYDLGTMLGLDRNTSSRVAENLIGLQFVEIRTLSGGIGISAEGAAEVQNMVGDQALASAAVTKLAEGPIMDSNGCQAVQQVTIELKNQAGNLGLDFDSLTELMADLKSIDVQLDSSRPKTAIIRECLRSIEATLDKFEDNESLLKIKGMLGE